MQKRALVLFCVAVFGCDDEVLRRTQKPPDPAPQPAAVEEPAPEPGPVIPPPVIEDPPPPPPPTQCEYGTIQGRVCATDQHTWLNGAEVSVTATDCDGSDVPIFTTTDSEGRFELTGVPVGRWNVHAELGSFEHDVAVDVAANATTAIEEDDLCVEQNDVKIAVITGIGDKIEDLLDTLQLTYTKYSGKDQWQAEGAALLKDLNAMKQYDIIFVNCGAALNNGKVEFGAGAATVKANLAAYVAGGGSIYASDWALLFADTVNTDKISWSLRSGTDVANPQATNQLMGYAPQTVTTDITDIALSAFLGKSQVSINFPPNGSKHWGVMEDIEQDVWPLVQAPSVTLCNTDNTLCDKAGMTATNIPFAVRYKLTPQNQRGGWVVYTSFHNIAQVGDDVAKILKFLILHL